MYRMRKLLAGTEVARGEKLVEAKDICKEYHTGQVNVRALNGIDLLIRRGEVVAIMGASGSGKTTLLNCLSGLDSVTSGQITIAGHSLTGLSDRQLTSFRAREMGFVFQSYNLLPVLSALENVELPLLVSGVRPREARERAWEGLEEVGLEDWAHHRPAELSGGQTQRVAIARALATRPAIVWADEPTGALDSKTGQEIISLMLDLNRAYNLTFVWVTHSPEVAQQAQRLVTMQDGRIVEDAAQVPVQVTNGPSRAKLTRKARS